MDDRASIEAPSPPRRRLARWLAGLLVPAVLGFLVFEQARWFREATCETYDEFTYLRMGICIYRHGDFASMASPMCPPLPILLEYGLPSFKAKSLPDTEGWDRQVPDLTRLARLSTSAFVGVPLVVLVYGWLGRRRGWAVGALGGGLVSLSPTVIAAASIATTDACFALFGVLALASLNWYVVRPSRGSFVAAGVGIGLALASKQSAAILFPVALVELLLKRPGWKDGWTGVDYALRLLVWVGMRLAGLVALAFLTSWALYGFGLAKFGGGGTYSTIPVIIPMVSALFPNDEAIMEVVRRLGMPLSIDTFLGQMNHASTGHGAFLMGQHSHRGWWYFFPVAIAVKSTPAELAIIALVVFLATRRSTWRDPTRRLWLLAAAAMLGAGMTSSVNIGQRYMILIYPLAILLAVDWLGEVATRHKVRAIAAGLALLAWQGVSIFGVAPHYLGYFNSFIGGPLEGHRYLVDSSLDWGQDLPSLRRELEARGYRKVALNYFGTANAAIYGLRSVDWAGVGEPEASECDWLAISATSYQGAYGSASELYHRFKGLPSIRVAYSIFLFDLKNPRIRAVWDAIRAQGRPRPALE